MVTVPVWGVNRLVNDSQYIEHINSLSDNALSIFIGAGLSKLCGLPDWKKLVEPYAVRLGLVDNNLPYPRIMQYALNNKAEYSLFLARLRDASAYCNPRVVHRLIARLNLPRIWTTNYDGILESAYDGECVLHQVVACDDDIYQLDYHRKQIIKMHGSLTDDKTTDIVLLESEYENYILYRRGIYQLLQTDIRSKSFLYFGFSFDDINIRRIVASAWNQKNFGKPSFLFTVPPIQPIKQKYYDCWKNDLARYNIKVVELNDYTGIETFMFNLLEARSGKTILLIGKRDDSEYNDLAFCIGEKLAKSGYKIHSGGGPNIANSMAKGAWGYLEKNNIPIDNRVVFFYRFSGGSTNPCKGQILYCGKTRSEVRKKMISPDKICLIIGDEKAGETGMEEEVQIARNKGARIIPVACSGDFAQRHWEAERHNYISGTFREKSDVYNILASHTTEIEKIADAVVELADYLLVRDYEK